MSTKLDSSEDICATNTCIEIVQQPPRYAVLEKWLEFEFKVNHDLLSDTHNNETSEAPQFIDFILNLCDTDKSDEDRNKDSLPVLTLDPSSPVRISSEKKQSTTKIKFKITQADAALSEFDSSFCILLQPQSSREMDKTRKLESVKTRKFKLAECNLFVEAEGWDNVWYKDEGGREKCMQVIVSLRNYENKVMKSRPLPLKLTLRYQNDQLTEVMRQDILHVFGRPPHEINKKTGSVTIRFRIEDVSKNHQGQNFLVELEADTPTYSGVAPAFTPSVAIRSKRNKRQRTTKSEAKSEGLNSRSPEAFHPLSGVSMARSPFSDSGQGGSDIDETAPMAFNGVGGHREIHRLREAMRGIIKWTEEVVNGLYPLQWQIVGYSPHPDGSFDYSRPYHTMPNPNARISKILSMYSESTREHLRVLIAAVENTRPDLPVRRQHLNTSMSSMRTDPHASMKSMSPPSQRRRSAHESHIGDHHLAPQAPLAPSHPYATTNPNTNPYNKYDSYNNFEPPWPGPYTSAKMANPNSMAGRRDLTYMSPDQPPPNRGMPPNSQLVPMPPDFDPSPHLDATSREEAHMAPHPMQTINPSMASIHHEPNLTPHHSEGIDVDDRQAEVAFVLATEYISMKTGHKLGFPAYTKTKELIGFYRESKVKTGSAIFTSISMLRHEIGPMEISQATQMLESHISRKSEAVHALQDWGTVRNLVDHAMVYDWNNGAEAPQKSTHGSPLNYI